MNRHKYTLVPSGDRCHVLEIQPSIERIVCCFGWLINHGDGWFTASLIQCDASRINRTVQGIATAVYILERFADFMVDNEERLPIKRISIE